jgi:hypothetical protein
MLFAARTSPAHRDFSRDFNHCGHQMASLRWEKIGSKCIPARARDRNFSQCNSTLDHTHVGSAEDSQSVCIQRSPRRDWGEQSASEFGEAIKRNGELLSASYPACPTRGVWG